MNTTTFPRLVGDIGGTNARFAWIGAPGAALADVTTLPCAEHASLQAAMQHYLTGLQRAAPRWCAIGIANPVVGDQVRMTNHHWSFSIEQVREMLGLERFLVINDFTALALSLPALDATELRRVGPGDSVAGAPLGCSGRAPGSVCRGCCRHTTACVRRRSTAKAGNVTLPPTDEREERVGASCDAVSATPRRSVRCRGPGW